MKIREEIIIDFRLGKYTKRCIEELEEIYKKAQQIKDKTSREYKKLDSKFYSLTTELEVCVSCDWRGGVFTEEQGDFILWKYDWYAD